jgi:hypothetical protein
MKSKTGVVHRGEEKNFVNASMVSEDMPTVEFSGQGNLCELVVQY